MRAPQLHAHSLTGLRSLQAFQAARLFAKCSGAVILGNLRLWPHIPRDKLNSLKQRQNDASRLFVRAFKVDRLPRGAPRVAGAGGRLDGSKQATGRAVLQRRREDGDSLNERRQKAARQGEHGDTTWASAEPGSGIGHGFSAAAPASMALPQTLFQFSGPDPKAMAIMFKMGFTPGSGLGASSQGVTAPVEAEMRAERVGLGFGPARLPAAGSTVAADLLAPVTAALLPAPARPVIEPVMGQMQELKLSRFYHDDVLQEVLRARAGLPEDMRAAALRSFAGPAMRSALEAWSESAVSLALVWALGDLQTAVSAGGVALRWESVADHDARLVCAQARQSALVISGAVAAGSRGLDAALASLLPGTQVSSAVVEYTVSASLAECGASIVQAAAAIAAHCEGAPVSLAVVDVVGRRELDWPGRGANLGVTSVEEDLIGVAAVRVALSCVAEGGALVVKLPDLMRRVPVGLLYILCAAFGRVQLVKATAPCPASPFAYAVCRDRVAASPSEAAMVQQLAGAQQAMAEYAESRSATTVVELVPYELLAEKGFWHALIAANERLGRLQLEALRVMKAGLSRGADDGTDAVALQALGAVAQGASAPPLAAAH